MRRLILGLALLAIVAIVGWLASAPPSVPPEVLAEVAQPGDAAAGKLVFWEGGCDACHMSPDQDDPFKLGGGRELKTPFGSFYPPNISQDAADGIGAWTVEDFAGALLAGRTPNGQPYYPALPYTSYTRMTPKDVRDLFAFFKTMPAIPGRVRAHALSFPFNVRRGVGLWQRLFFTTGPLAPAPDLNAEMQRGRYLVEGPGHCEECHTPRNAFGAVDSARRLRGGPSPDGRGKVPDITAAGLKDWSGADIEEVLSIGSTPAGDILGGAMAAVVRNIGQLPDSDRAAIAAYLKSVGAPKP